MFAGQPPYLREFVFHYGSNKLGIEFFGYLGKGFQGGLIETAKVFRDPSAVWNFLEAVR